jgi:hypothetical protein
VAAYLAAFDLSDFDPKAPPPKTPAFWEIVDASRPPEEGELEDVLDEMGNPDVVTLAQLIAHSTGETQAWLADRKNRRVLPHRLGRVEYVPVRNPDTGKDQGQAPGGLRQGKPAACGTDQGGEEALSNFIS